MEHLLHICMDRTFAHECWRVMGLAFVMSTVEAAPGWFLGRLATEMSKVKVPIATVLWGVWGARNFKVWKQKVLTPTIVM